MTKPIANVLGSVLTSLPGVSVRRLSVKGPADDDNMWFVRQSSTGPEVQIESDPDGSAPFLIEGDDHKRVQARTVDEAVDLISRLLAGM